MARILSHPFRLSGAEVATVEQASEAGQREQLLVLLQTRRGERALVPSFGVTEPAFALLDVAEVRLAVALHGPAVEVHEVVHRVLSDTEAEVEVRFGD